MGCGSGLMDITPSCVGLCLLIGCSADAALSSASSVVLEVSSSESESEPSSSSRRCDARLLVVADGEVRRVEGVVGADRTGGVLEDPGCEEKNEGCRINGTQA